MPRRRSPAKVSAAEQEYRLPGRRALPRPGPAADGRCRPERLEKEGLDAIAQAVRREHKRLFTFALPPSTSSWRCAPSCTGKKPSIKRRVIAKRRQRRRAAAAVGKQKSYMVGKRLQRPRSMTARKLKSGNRIAGPAIVIEMDSTTVILPEHTGEVDAFGNILIYPDKSARKAAQHGGRARSSGRRNRRDRRSKQSHGFRRQDACQDH